ncbi:MAG: hypothetical protein R3A48_19380 [Polyangiales bacterium]
MIPAALRQNERLAYTCGRLLALSLWRSRGRYRSGAVIAVLNAYTTELFATRDRAEAFAWSNNLLGRSTYVISPIVLGYTAERVGWGPSVGATSVFALAALALILVWLPETRGRELEDTARVD